MKTLLILLFTFLSFIPKFELSEVNRLCIDLNGNGKKDTLVFLKTQYDDPGDYHYLRVDWDDSQSMYIKEEYGAWIKDEYFTKIGKANSDLLAVVEINGKSALILKEYPSGSSPSKYMIYTFDQNGKDNKIFEEHLEKFEFSKNMITGERPDEDWIRHKKVYRLKGSRFFLEK